MAVHTRTETVDFPALREMERRFGTRRTWRDVLFAAVSTAAEFAERYAYYRSRGFTRAAARRKARWHIR